MTPSDVLRAMGLDPERPVSLGDICRRLEPDAPWHYIDEEWATTPRGESRGYDGLLFLRVTAAANKIGAFLADDPDFASAIEPIFVARRAAFDPWSRQ